LKICILNRATQLKKPILKVVEIALEKISLISDLCFARQSGYKNEFLRFFHYRKKMAVQLLFFLLKIKELFCSINLCSPTLAYAFTHFAGNPLFTDKAPENHPPFPLF